MSAEFNRLLELELIDWSTILFGIKRHWIRLSDIADYSYRKLLSGSDNGDEALLASASTLSWDEVISAVSRLSGGMDEYYASQKWKLAKLLVISESGLTDVEMLNQIEDVYAEFDYPEDMSDCSKYSVAELAPLDAMDRLIRELMERLISDKNN